MASRKESFLEIFHQYGIYQPKRLIKLFGEIDTDKADQVISNLIAIDQQDESTTILLNTPGGSWYDGLAIYDTIASCKSHVTAIATGSLMSMGPIVSCAADSVFVSSNCRILLHYGTDGFEGNSADLVAAGLEAKAAQMKQEAILLTKIREKHPRYRVSDLRKKLITDTYMSPEEFVELGLAEKVV